MKKINRLFKFVGVVALVAMMISTALFNQKLSAESYDNYYAGASYTALNGLQVDVPSIYTYKEMDFQNRYVFHHEMAETGLIKKIKVAVKLPNEKGITVTNYKIKAAERAGTFDFNNPAKDGGIIHELNESKYTITEHSASGELEIEFAYPFMVPAWDKAIYDYYVQIDYSFKVDEAKFNEHNPPTTTAKWKYTNVSNKEFQVWENINSIHIQVDAMNLRAVDESGNDLIPVTAVTAENGGTLLSTSYSTTAPEVPGYTLVKTPENANGVFTLAGGDIIYKYQKDDAVTVPDPDPELPTPELPTPELPMPENPGSINTGDDSDVGELFTMLLGSVWLVVRKVKLN